MEISCAFPPAPDVADHVACAEQLGYRRAWLYDSSALYGDVWVHLALCAQQTERIELGPAVLVPGFRHPLTQASAIATLCTLAPGRVVVAVGTGFTGRYALGQAAHTWAETTDYIATLQGLLAGHAVDIDGAVCRMIPPPGFLPDRPIEVPIIVAANGPKGLSAARALGAAGVMSVLAPQPDWAWSSLLVMGTVLDPGEDPGSERAIAAAGAAATVVYHAAYEGDTDALDGLPGGSEWREAIESVPVAERHLAVHEDHLVSVTERDRPLVTGDLLQSFTWTGTPDDVRARLEGFEAAGGTEILYAPSGPDIARELRAFAEACAVEPD